MQRKKGVSCQNPRPPSHHPSLHSPNPSASRQTHRKKERVDARQRPPVRTVDPPPLAPNFHEKNHRPHPCRIHRGVRQQQPRVLQREPVFKTYVAGYAEGESGGGEEGELDDGHVCFWERLDGKVRLWRSVETIGESSVFRGRAKFRKEFQCEESDRGEGW